MFGRRHMRVGRSIFMRVRDFDDAKCVHEKRHCSISYVHSPNIGFRFYVRMLLMMTIRDENTRHWVARGAGVCGQLLSSYFPSCVFVVGGGWDGTRKKGGI